MPSAAFWRAWSLWAVSFVLFVTRLGYSAFTRTEGESSPPQRSSGERGSNDRPECAGDRGREGVPDLPVR
jgi:hypothetical protein